MNNFFPAPEIPYEEPQLMEVIGAAVERIQIGKGQKDVIVVAKAVDAQQREMKFRFSLPNHARVVREFFKVAGVKWGSGPSRIDNNYTVDSGAFLLNLSGTAVGEDKIPADLQNPPVAAYVVEKAKAQRLTP